MASSASPATSLLFGAGASVSACLPYDASLVTVCLLGGCCGHRPRVIAEWRSPWPLQDDSKDVAATRRSLAVACGLLADCSPLAGA